MILLKTIPIEEETEFSKRVGKHFKTKEYIFNLHDLSEYKAMRINLYEEVKKANKCDIHEGKIGKKIQHYDFKRPFTVDGFDKTTKTIYQFHGCYWHGCRKCRPENEVKYDKTIEQNNVLKLNGYSLVEMWECEWNQLKKTLANKKELEHQARQQHINIRDAFVGGRTEGFKTYHQCNEDETGFYIDLVSLYPTVNSLDPYAIGFARYRKIKSVDWFIDEIKNSKLFGFAKVDVIPNKKLYVPVLPDRSTGKLLFHLKPMYNKIFTSVELKLAIEKGYQVTKVHSFLQFDKYEGLMKQYVAFFKKNK